MTRVLIVDDEVFFTSSLQTYIDWNALGCQVVGAAADGVEALEMAKTLAPDLIFLDIQMPRMDGLEVLRRLKEGRHPARVVMLTGFNQFDFAIKALRLGADDYIYKGDLGAESLAAAVRSQTHGIKAAAPPPPQNRRPGEAAAELLRKAINSMGPGNDDAYAALAVKPANLYLLSFTLADPAGTRQRYGERSRILYDGVQNLMDELFCNEPELETLFYDKNTFCIIKSFSKEASSRAMDKELDYIAGKAIRQLYKFYNLRLHCGISRRHSRLDALPKAYDEAFLAGLAEFSLEQDRAHHHSVVAAMQMPDYLPVEPHLKELNKALAMQNTEACREVFRSCLLVGQSGILVLPAVAKTAAKSLLYPLEQDSARRKKINTQIDRCPTRTALLSVLDEWLEGRFAGYIYGPPPSGSELVRQAAAYVQAHYPSAELSLETTAAHIGASASYLSRVFKKQLGVGFSDYVNRVRVEAAKTLLEEEQEMVYQIAGKVGYRNVEHFNRLFKKHTGQSPKEYRGSRG